MSVEFAFLAVLCVATAVALLTRRFRFPYTVGLVLAGVAIGAVSRVVPPRLTKELLFTVFLPGLLFEAAFNLGFAQFRRNATAIGTLAVPGLAASIALTATIVVAALRALGTDPAFAWSGALLFGALVAATDPIAVVAIFRAVRVPERLSVLVEGESLLNDGTSVVALGLLLAFVSGAVPTAGGLALSFLTVTLGGALVGGTIGLAAALVTKRVDEPTIEITLTVLAAYGAFLVAEHWHLSGVIATVTAGMLFGSYVRHVGMSAVSRAAVEGFWEYVAFALNSAVFLLLGFSVQLSALARSWRDIAVGFLALLVARAIVVVAVRTLLARTRERFSWAWAAVLTWGGLRGALSLVLALALPADVADRERLVTMTAGVVLASILVQGLSVGVLLRRLDVAEHDPPMRGADGEPLAPGD